MMHGQCSLERDKLVGSAYRIRGKLWQKKSLIDQCRWDAGVWAAEQ